MTNLDELLPLLHSFEGGGRLHIEGQAVLEALFTFEQHQDGTLRLICTLPVEAAWPDIGGAGYGDHIAKRWFVGLTHDNWSLQARKLFSSETGVREGVYYAEFLCSEATLTPLDEAQQPRRGQPHFVRVPIVNFWFSPQKMGTHIFANGFKVDGPQVPLQLKGQELTLCYHRDASNSMDVLRARRIAGVLSDAFIPVTNWPHHHDLEEMLVALCSLLTFTHDTRVNWLGYDVCDAQGEVLHRFFLRTATSGYMGDQSGSSWSILPFIELLPSFLEIAYEHYQQLWDDWDIYALITLFTELRGRNYFLEVTGLHFCSCIEILNTTYKNRVGKRSFYQALEEVCTAVGFPVEEKDLRRFTDNRNALVHEGFFHIPDAIIDPKTLRPRERWDWYNTKVEARDHELHFMEDFVGTLIFCALGGNKRLLGW